MAALTEIVKRDIVQRLACFDTPSEVAAAIREEHGVEVERQQVNNYDASKDYARKRMAKPLVELFDETRARFRERVEDIPIANKAVRLRRLNRIADRAAVQKNPVVEMEAMERAAREVGDAYTNLRRLDHTSKGEPIGAVEVVVSTGRPPGSARPEPQPADAVASDA